MRLTEHHPKNAAELISKIKLQIVFELMGLNNNCDLSDLGNVIGIAVSKIACQGDHDSIGFDKVDFMHGINHGYSLNAGQE